MQAQMYTCICKETHTQTETLVIVIVRAAWHIGDHVSPVYKILI